MYSASELDVDQEKGQVVGNGWYLYDYYINTEYHRQQTHYYKSAGGVGGWTRQSSPDKSIIDPKTLCKSQP